MTKGIGLCFLAGAVLSAGMADSYGGPPQATVHAGGNTTNFEQLFAAPGPPLTSELALISCVDESCCAPVGCSENTCCAPVGCDLGCGESCGTGCGEGCGCDDSSCGGITIGGWVQAGYHSGVTPAATARNDAGSFNNHPHRFNLHQGWLYAEKVADGSNGMDWGFRADIMYGVDAGDTQSFGNPAGVFDNGGSWNRGGGYGWAMPQLYAEVASGDISVKLGHFYTLIGYEVVTAPDNFFYSHALTMFNSEPFTHTGALVTYNASDDLTVYGGWTAGWDTGFSSVNGGSSFLGGFSTPVADNITFTYINTMGNFGARPNNMGNNDGYSHSLLFDIAVTDALNYVVQSDLVRWGNDDDVGLNQYLIYTVNDKIGVGCRAEWWKNEGNSQYALTGGVNIRPTDNLIIRPEIRHDYHLPGGGPASTTTFGMDAILTF